MDIVYRNQLIDKVLSPQNMEEAWEKVRSNKGAPGPDGWNVNRWERSWEENINRIRYLVKTNSYRANPPRRIQVIKRTGGIREICLFNVSDRVLQRAVLNVIDPIFDTRFLDCSHGYRTKRSCATAIQQVVNYRNRGLRWVFDADIESCFDSIDHQILMERIQRIVRDWFVLNLTGLWLKASLKKNSKTLKGIPQGAVISPLWCNIFLHNLDARLCCAGYKVVRYADDFIILTQSQEEAEEVIDFVTNILRNVNLKLASAKTRITNFDHGFRFLGVDFLDDSISYVCRQKTISIQGKNPSLIFKYFPEFY